jgi:hypothetical protein
VEGGQERREHADAEAGPDAEEDQDGERVRAVGAALNLSRATRSAAAV